MGAAERDGSPRRRLRKRAAPGGPQTPFLLRWTAVAGAAAAVAAMAVVAAAGAGMAAAVEVEIGERGPEGAGAGMREGLLASFPFQSLR